MSTPPKTLVDEEKIPLEETAELSLQDDWRAAERKGLYEQPEKVVVIKDEAGKIIAVTTAGKLLGEIVSRSWRGPLRDARARLPRLPVVSASAPVASLDALVQTLRDADWLLVVDEEGGPVGVLERRVVVDNYLPPIDTTQEVYRRGEARLWGSPTEEISFWYCEEEELIYLQHKVHKEGEHMVCPKGHRVQKYSFGQKDEETSC